MEPHVFCGPEFILEVPRASVPLALQRGGDAAAAPAESGGSTAASSGPSPSPQQGWTVQPEFLLRIQDEIFSICTPEVRRRIHAQLALRECAATDVRKAMGIVSRRMANFGRIQLPADYTGAGGNTAGSTGSSVPAAPRTLAFLEAKPTHALSAEETSSIAQSVRAAASAASSSTISSSTSAPSDASNGPMYVLLYVTDSRAAAQLHMLCLRRTYLALPSSCRLLNYYVFGGRAAAVVPSLILQKREVLAANMNFDAELWGVLEAKLTSDLVEEVRSAGRAHHSQGTATGGGRLLTAFEQHEEDVRAVLHFCEQKVRYAGVFDDDEEASPFLIAMGLCWRLRLTMDDVCRHFARHPRRVIRALALYLARYTLAPEDFVYVFMPSMCDEVIIACTEDAQVTYSMREVSRQLLTKNDIVDAWLPMLAKYWQDQVVAPAIDFMEACWRLQGSAGERDGATAPTSAALFAEADGTASGGGGGGELDPRGAGRGIAAMFGFRSIAEIADHAAQHARVLVPQSMATILKRRRGLEEEVFGTGGDGEGDADALDHDDDEDDDFLIHVDVQGEEEEEGDEGRRAAAVGGGQGLDFASAKRSRVEQRDGAASRSAASGGGGAGGGGPLTDPHRRIMREGLKLTLSLLGRRKLFKDNDEHYIEF